MDREDPKRLLPADAAHRVAAALLTRFGSPVRFAARAIVGALLPDNRGILELIARLFDAVDPTVSGPDSSTNASAAEYKRAAELLEVLTGELAGLVGRVAALEKEESLALLAIEMAMTSDPRYRAVVERLAQIGLAAEAKTLGLADADSGGSPAVVLEVIAGPHRGVRFEYDCHDTLLVGRGATANLQLIDDPHFSRHHFLLEFNPPRIYLRDLGSSNGTRVNGQVATECFLNEGDEIAGGKTRIKVIVPKPKAESPRTVTRAPATVKSVGFDLSAVTGDHAPAAIEDLPNFIPGYEVVRKLGAGGMGAVFLARHCGSGDEFAVKLMLPESAASERAMRLFLREVSVLSKLDHPNVVRHHEMGSALGQFYFVMEYVPADSLTELAASLPPDRRTRFVSRAIALALDGLAYAHSRGFVHRDFKPANLLVTGTIAAPAVKIADFGLAKSFQNAGFSGMTLAGQAAGTLAFMAPEQITNCRDAKPTADLYAVGATIYTLLAGRIPLDVRPNRDPVRVLLEDEPTPLASVCPWVPSGLAAIVHRLLKKQPADRFPDAATVRAALAPFLT